MTREQAAREAVRRYGVKGSIVAPNEPYKGASDKYRILCVRERMGVGDSWEAAFADADRKEAASAGLPVCESCAAYCTREEADKAPNPTEPYLCDPCRAKGAE